MERSSASLSDSTFIQSEEKLKTHLCQLCRADEPVSLLVENTESFPDLVLDVRVLELSELQIIKPYLLFPDRVISQTNSWKLMSPSPSWSRRAEMIKYCTLNCFILTLGHFKPPTWSITLTISFSSSSEGDHPKLVITWLRKLIKIQNAPKRLFWGGSSSWDGGQLQKERHCIVWEIKEKIQNTKILCETQRPSADNYKRKTLYEI